MTPEEARRVQNAYDVLKPRVEGGTASDAEARAFQTLSGQLQAAQQETGATGARYRGLKRGASVGLSDDIAGVASAIRGDGFQAGRQSSLEADRASQANFPDEFATGQTAGGGAIAGATLFAGSPALTGLNMLGKMAAGGAAGTALGAGQGQSNYEMAGSPEGQRLDYYAGPMTVGGATGAATYPMGQAAGAIVRALRNKGLPTGTGYGTIPSRTLASRVQSTEDSGTDLQSYLGGLTPEATLSDVPGDLQGTAQGLVAIRGPGGSRVAREITQRADGAGQRITDELDSSIRPANAAFAERRRLAAERSGQLGPEYDAALASPDPLQVESLLDSLDSSMGTAGTDTAPILRRYVEDLRAKSPDGVIRPEQLHWIRSDLSAALRDAPGGKRNVLLGGALRDIDAVLDSVPGYSAARTGYANNMAMEDAIDSGQEALRGTRASASSPAEFEAQFNAMSPAQQDAFKTGIRRDVDALMGMSSNDAAAAWRELNDKGWNQEKLRLVLGDAADPIIRRLRSEKVFSDTRGRVVAGSRTGETRAASEALGPYRDPETGIRPGPIQRAKGAISEPVNNMIDSFLYRNQPGRNSELGEMLTAKGADRDELVRALMDLSRRQSAPSGTANQMNAVVRALTAAGGGSLIAGQ